MVVDLGLSSAQLDDDNRGFSFIHDSDIDMSFGPGVEADTSWIVNNYHLTDLERMIKATPEENKSQPLYEWILALQKSLLRDIESLWVVAFESIWTEVDPNKHEVMTQIPGEEWIIIDEFEKWYLLWDKVLRVAKVIVWSWN